MSDELDFSGLSDDQLVELAVALAREAMSRNPALSAAFGQALLDERARVEAAAKGTEKVRKAEAERIERQAAAAANAVAQERERRRIRTALSAYLVAGAETIGHDPRNLCLIWTTTSLVRRGCPRLQLALGPKGEHADWFLVDYGVPDDQLYTSPGMRRKEGAILAWCREAAAAIQALGVARGITLKGIEL